MKNTLIILSIVAVFLIGTYFLIKVSLNNKEIRLRNLTVAQQETCKANFDKMFKVIKQVAQIPERFADKSKEAFEEIYPQLMTGRYSNERGGALMSWVSEHNPSFDMVALGKLYEKLSNAIESNRAEFFNEQKKLISYQKQHKNLIETWPGNWLIKDENKVEIEITIITSTATEEVFETGKEDDIELF